MKMCTALVQTNEIYKLTLVQEMQNNFWLNSF